MASQIFEDGLSKVGIHVKTDNVFASSLLGAAFLLSSWYIAQPILSYIRLVLSLFVLPGTSLSKFGKKGTWAVVTGASDGIGKEFALQIARKGFNIVLISRTQSKLDALAKELQEKLGVQTKTFAMDFSNNLDVDFHQMRALLENLDISILVNNVGQSHSIPVPFVETQEKEMLDIITINCMGTLRTTRIVVEGMIKRKRGLILTMASFGGLTPTPLLATYSGSKAFLQQWSSALGSELAPKGVQVQLVQSYLVTSAMSKIRRASALIPTPKDFVRATLNKIGRSGGAQNVAFTSSPYWTHGILHWAMTTFLGTHNRFLIDQNKGAHEAIRKRALKKAEREAKKGQ